MRSLRMIKCVEYFNLVLPDDAHRAYNERHSDPFARTNLHNELAEEFDVDRELITELIERVCRDNSRPEPFGMDYNKAFIAFIDGMTNFLVMSGDDRHPKKKEISEEEVKELKDLSGLPTLESEELKL